ncbi:NACHT domain-containing protein [Pseudanabaena minima]|uniref:NACHT domain-containing protein n=1 Tax=Pseudanabaena minima TaxID=890415 RepID=UPI003DA981FC
MTDTLPLSIQPVISYPKEAEVGKTYLMEIDLQMPESGFEWQYEEEEYLIYCMVNAGNLFTVTSVGEPAIVLHRFGGTYGSAKILLEAALEEKSGTFSVLFVNQWGTNIRTITLAVIIEANQPIQNSKIVAFIDSLDKRQKRNLSQNIPIVSPIASLFQQVNQFLQQPIRIDSNRNVPVVSPIASLFQRMNQFLLQPIKNDFESRYLEEQKYVCYRDEADGVREEDHLDNYPVLPEIFVPLRLIDSPREIGFNRYEELEGGQISDIWQLLRNSQDKEKLKRISIRARGGYGKTTLLKYLAYTYSNRAYGDYKAPKFIPFLLYLSRCVKFINQDDSLELPQLLTDHAHKLLENQECTAPDDWAKNLLLNGQALVMLDGFDEIPSSEERVKVSTWLNREMQKYRKSVFMLTSRPTAYRLDYPNKKLFMNYWINDFDDKQRQEFLEKCYIYQEGKAAKGLDRGIERKAKTMAKSLLDQIDMRPELKALSGNALMLNMMVRYHRDKKGKDLPQRKFELYRGILELQLDRRPTEKGIGLLLNSATERQKVLQFVALEMMKSATDDSKEYFKQIRRDVLLYMLKIGLDRFNSEVNVEQFLVQMVDVSEMLVRGDENYHFSHLSFQEFLAASELVQLKEEGEALLFENLNLNVWKDTILFYASLTPNPDRLFQKLVDLDNGDLAHLIYSQIKKANVLESLEKLVINKRYRQLESYLKAKEWKNADRETYKLILSAVGKELGQYLSEDNLRNFPCDELLAIDRLWIKYSNGLYGFSIQRQIYIECGGKLDFSYPSSETWNKFCDRVAWMDRGKYVFYSDIFMSKFLSIKGHLPLISDYEGGEGKVELFLFSRIATCEM